jgi:glucokinase
MRLLAIDLGGTKLAIATFTEAGMMTNKDTVLLNGRRGKQVGKLIADLLTEQLKLAKLQSDPVAAIAVSVPGISNVKNNLVWAPNIPEWEAYPLLQELQELSGGIPVCVESDRSCYILGEVWQGAAKGCQDAIYLAVGTGIGAGIIAGGQLLRGANDIAGAIGWLALAPAYQEKYKNHGQFEYYTSGPGILRLTRELLHDQPGYRGLLHTKDPSILSTQKIFAAYQAEDELATQVFKQCVEYWGMAIANLVSLFNPEKIILGGGVFGPAIPFIPAIHEEVKKWGQPISTGLFSLEASALGTGAGLYGAGYAALKCCNTEKTKAHAE